MIMLIAHASTSGKPDSLGVIPGQPPEVVQQAGRFAAGLGAEIVCVWVNPTAYMEPANDQWGERPVPIDPDGVDSEFQDPGTGMIASLAEVLKPLGVTWSFQSRAGDPARELAHVANRVRASMIVVGTREPGFGARLEELLTGSVAVHLAHHQSCPVMVIPLRPKPFNEGRR